MARFTGVGFLPQDTSPGGPVPSNGPVAVDAGGSAVAVLVDSAGGPEAALWTSIGGLVDLGPTLIPTDISSDGSVVVGFEGPGVPIGAAWSWTAAAGLVRIGVLPDFLYSEPFAVSANGQVVVGWDGGGANPYSNSEAFVWTAAAGMVGLGFLPAVTGVLPVEVSSTAIGVSADGLVVVGESGDVNDQNVEAFVWTAATGMVGLGSLPGDVFSVPTGISADGSAVVGFAFESGNSPQFGEAFRWTQADGMIGLGFLPNYQYTQPTGVSADGSVVIGNAFNYNSSSGGTYTFEAFRWTAATGMVGLGVLPGENQSSVLGMSADGNVVLGCCASTSGPFNDYFLWDPVFGMQALAQVLTSEYGLNFNGWSNLQPQLISADGSTVTGVGTDPNGMTEAFVVSGLLENLSVDNTYTVAPGQSDAIGMLGGTGTVQIGAGASLSVAGNNTSSDPVDFPNSVFSGTVTGSGDLIKAGTGLWLFDGAFQSTGHFFIDAGTLAIGPDASIDGGVTFQGASGAILKIDSPSTFNSPINGLAPGDIIDLVKTTVLNDSLAGSSLVLDLSSGQTLTYNVGGALALTTVTFASDGDSGTDLTLSIAATFTAAQINEIYEAVLQRPAATAEQNLWVSAEIAGQITAPQVLSEIVTSAEAIDFVYPVIRLYEAAFDRVPDQPGLMGWVGALAAGALTEAQVAQDFVNSPEFLVHYGTTQVSTSFVSALYENVLGRQGSASEIDAWVNSGESASQILMGVSDSAESFHDTQAKAVGFLTAAALGTETYTGSLFG